MKLFTVNKRPPRTRVLLLLAVIVAAPEFARADTEVWTGNGGSTATTNWSDTANWSGTAHNPNDNDAKFFDVGATSPQGTVDNVVDLSTNCYSLAYANTNGQFHTTLIAPGQTLTIDGNSSGNSLIAGTLETGTALNEYTTIDGTNATLKMSGGSVGTVFVGQGGTGTSAKATLDMQGLDNFTANITRMMIGVGNTRYCGILYLAKTNVLAFSGASPQLDIGDNSGNNGSGSLLYLGITNLIAVDSVAMGLKKQNSGNSGIRFNPAFTNLNPVVIFRGTNSPTSAVSTWAMGDGTGASATDTETGVADFTGGTITAFINSMWLARPSAAASGGYTANGTFTFTGGKVVVNNLTNATLASSTGPETATGIINASGGTLSVNNNLVLAALNGFTGNSRGTLNVTNATALINNLVAGGGTSTLNLIGSTLVLTNSGGTTLSPLTSMTTSNALLQVNVGSLNPVFVATTLTTDGTTNMINVASVPVVTTYPAQFPIIQYSGSINGLGFNFGLGTLPAGSPPYQGYISNNTSSVDLVLTSGPVPVGLDVWNGAVNANWDFTTLNWTNLGVAALFHTGDAIKFDDTAVGSTTVNLTGNLNPSTLTVSNISKAYAFDGPGALVNSASLIKSGSGSLVVTNSGTNTFGGGITINAGTLQFGNGTTLGNLPVNNQPITDNANLVLNHAGNVSVQNTILGTGNLTLNGPGNVSLVASNGYTGTTVINAGSLLVDGYIGGGGVLSNAVSATIGGIGTNIGPLNASGTLSPGDANAIGTYSVVGDATFYSGALLTADLNAGDTTMGNNVNDLLQVAGNLNANNTTISVNVRGIPQSGMNYGVITYSGALSGTFNSTVAGTHYAASVDTSVPNQVNVNITGSSGANLKWTSTTSGAWDSSSVNWLNLGTSLADKFYSGDAVLFDDSVANVITNIFIAVGTTNYPTAVTNISSANNYTISGGAIGGPTGIFKDGTGTLTISNANTFTGEVDVMAGTLKVGSGAALGTTAAGTVIASGATLDVNGQNLGSETVTVSGSGVGGLGALINSGGQQVNAFKNVTLTGDVVFGGTGRWDIRGGSATLQASGTPVNITKIGTNQVSLVACTCSDANLENLNILQGTFAIQTTSTQFGDANGFIFVTNNAFLSLYNLSAGLNKNIVLYNGGGLFSENGSTTISGAIILTNAAGQGTITNQSGTTLIVNSVVEGSGNLVKSGPGTTHFAAANTYTGSTTVAGGTLMLDAAGVMDSSPAVSVAAGATIDVSAIAPWNLAAGQTLAGGGAINGSVTISATSTLAPGSAVAVGTLTDTGNITLSGTNIMKVQHGVTATNDILAATGTITLGGTLNIALLGGGFAGGDTFTLFKATGGLSGSFAVTNLPALPTGLFWVSTNLVNGILSIGSTVNPNPTNIIVSVSGNTLTLSWPSDHTGWILQSQTNNLGTGLSATGWTDVAGSGSSNTSIITINPQNPTVFYRLRRPF